MLKINLLTLILITIFTLPILVGFFTKYSREKIQCSLWSLCDGLEFILVLFLAIYLTRGIFFQHNTGLFAKIYNLIPEEIQDPIIRAGYIHIYNSRTFNSLGVPRTDRTYYPSNL